MRVDLGFSLLVLMLLGCVGSEEMGDDDTSAAVSASAPEPLTAPQQAVREAMTTSPEAALELFLVWDTAGLRLDPEYNAALRNLKCYIPDDDCLSPEAGWDMYVVVESYSWEKVYSAPDSAVFVISFDQVGWLPVSERGFRPFPPDTVRFRRMAEGWRIVGIESVMRPHLSLARVLDKTKSAADSARVREWLTSFGGSRN